MSRVLVTGGAGFIGCHLVRRLLSDGNEVIVLDNFYRSTPAALGDLSDRVEVVEGDIRDRETLRRTFRGVETVYHLAAQSNVLGALTDIDYSFSTNVIGTFEVLSAAEASGVQRVVYTSSREVYGEAQALPVWEDAPLNAKNAYGASKLAGELYCRVFASRGLQTAVLRLANVYGPGDRDRVIPLFLDAAKAGKPLRLYGGGQVLDLIRVDVVVEALARAGDGRPVPVPVNVGSGRGTTVRELAQRVLGLTGSASLLDVQPARSFETSAFVAGVRRCEEVLGLRVEQDDPLSLLPQMAAG